MNQNENTQQEQKKVSLQEAMKQQLERKKQAKGNGNQQNGGFTGNQRMKSQQSKKASVTRRKMGG
ncbi:hypothetical protein FZC84_01615 [Rossellomorea vietnamensis]|uniref:Uncharacterized protein n=2 Tax=Bacillales TaxID=1385 RepID=A0A5D4MIE7_9BACI|nr:hypothetical protein FZC84_01615 [Rossellomorea vietnamensis]